MSKNKKANGIEFAHVGFFLWLHSVYGNEVKATYKQISAKTRRTYNIAYGTVRLYLLALEKANYLTIENKGKLSQIYRLNETILKKLV